jgi:hypothetical protein
MDDDVCGDGMKKPGGCRRAQLVDRPDNVRDVILGLVPRICPTSDK